MAEPGVHKCLLLTEGFGCGKQVEREDTKKPWVDYLRGIHSLKVPKFKCHAFSWVDMIDRKPHVLVSIKEWSMSWAYYWGQYKTRFCPLERYSRFNASIPQAFQENAFDIPVDTFRSLVSLSTVRECITKTLQTPPSSKDVLTCVKHIWSDKVGLGSIIYGGRWREAMVTSLLWWRRISPAFDTKKDYISIKYMNIYPFLDVLYYYVACLLHLYTFCNLCFSKCWKIGAS